MVIDRIELQRGSEGRPLGDVIVQAHHASGTAAILEIQIKREIAFSPADEVLRDVVQQIAAARCIWKSLSSSALLHGEVGWSAPSQSRVVPSRRRE